VDDAVAKGAIVHCGGKPFQHPDYPQGQFFSPTVLSNVTPAMRIHTEEVFGPVLLVYKFKTAADAIAITNATGFGLSSAVFSLDYPKAEAVLRQLDVGMTNVNGWCFNYLCGSLPFGGVKKSGFDRFGGVEGLRGNCHVRSATTDRFRSIGIRTNVPELLNFPISKTSYQFQTALAEVIYGNSLVVKFAGVRKIVKITMFGSL
jgi:aldehyde dehydrogenase (NAD+)